MDNAATKILSSVLLVIAWFSPGSVWAQDSLTWTNTDSEVLALLASEGMTGGEQIDASGQSVGGLTVGSPTSATYPRGDLDLRATVVLDSGRDLYRFEGAEECAGVLEVRWVDPQGQPIEVLDARLVAAAAVGDGAFRVQAVSTVGQSTFGERMLVRGGQSFWVDVSFAHGADTRGQAVTYSRMFETAVGCGQIVTLDVEAATGAASVGLSDVQPATSSVVLPGRGDARDLLDAMVSPPTVQAGSGASVSGSFDGFATGGAFQKSTGGSSAAETCSVDAFDGPDLDPVWSLANIGDADQAAAEIVGGRLEVTGDGTTFFHDTDNGAYLFQNVSGDFRATATLAGAPIDQGGDFRKLGLVVRESDDPLAARVMVKLVVDHPVLNTTVLQFDARDETGDAFEMASSPVDLSLPLFVSIDRRGDTFTVRWSTDGSRFLRPRGGRSQGQVTIPMAATAQVGLSVSSYDADTTLTGAFDDFELCRRIEVPAPTPPPAVGCQSERNVDMIYLLDSSGSMVAPFTGFPSKLEAAADAIAQTNALLSASYPNARSALVAFRGSVLSDPAFNLSQGAQVLAPLTTDLDAVSAAAAAIDPSTIDVDANTPLPIALDLTTDLLQSTAGTDLRRFVVLLTDGAPNIDSEGRGAGEYQFSEILPLSIRDAGGNFLPWTQIAFLGNFNGGIRTYDGQVFGDTVREIQRMRDLIPDSRIFPIAIEGEDTFYEDLLAFAAFYNSTPLLRANDTTSLADALAAVLDEVNCGGTIGDLVWQDTNGNGKVDRGEGPIGGVTVELRDASGNLVGVQVTDPSGLYLFENVPPGTYTVTVDVDSLPVNLRTPTADFDGVATPNTATLTLGAGETNLELDFGYRPSASIGDRLWSDLDADGVQDAGEPGLEGVSVQLLDAATGNPVASGVTGADGLYLFDQLLAGSYTVVVDPSTLPAGAGVQTFDLDGLATPNQATVTVSASDSRLDLDFGYQPTASIGDRVWLDLDGDGVQDSGEAGLEFVTVRLLDGAGTEVASQQTGADGLYLFADLAPGTYTVAVDPATLPTGTGAQTFDFDGLATADRATVTVAAGENQLEVDFGYTQADECEEGTFRDDFSTSSFGNQDGSLDWSADWVEEDPLSDGPGAGQVQVHDGLLTLDDNPNTGAEPSVAREADLSNAGRALLRYEFVTSHGVDFDDAVTVEVSPDGGVTWNTLEVITGISGFVRAERVFDITAFATETTRVRFRVSNKYGGHDELFCLDFVEIVKECAECLGKTVRDEFDKRTFSNNDGPDAWSAAWFEVDPLGAGPTAGAVRVDPGSGFLTFNLEETASEASIAREVSLAGIETARLAFNFVTSNKVDAEDAFLVEISTDGGETFTVLDTVDGIVGYQVVERSYDISAFASERTVVRFRLAPGSYQGWGEAFCIDWVEIAALCEGEVFLGSIGGVVWRDLNGNGIIEDPSNGLAGVQVELKREGTLLATAWTDDAGRYTFNDLEAGDAYQVQVIANTLPAELDEQTFDIDGTSSANLATFDLGSGEDRTDVNFGYRGSSSCHDCHDYSGWLSGSGDYDYQPDGNYFWSHGDLEGWLEGDGHDFDLHLFRWQWGRWVRVARSELEGTSSEHVSFWGQQGYYIWKVVSWQGSGSYTLSFRNP
ncbi:MAG: SdrD B-like domain-containing protein [Acidobacteriota bacterium]